MNSTCEWPTGLLGHKTCGRQTVARAISTMDGALVTIPILRGVPTRMDVCMKHLMRAKKRRGEWKVFVPTD